MWTKEYTLEKQKDDEEQNEKDEKDEKTPLFNYE